MKNDTTINIIKVVGTNAAAFGVTLSQINEALTALSLTLATAYTIYKFIKDLKKN